MAINAKVLALSLFASTANAELLSEHNEQHAAIQAAANRLYDNGCIRVESPRTTRFGVHSAINGEYPVTGNGFTVKCVKWQSPATPPAPTIINHDLTWSRPNLRIDGTTLPADQISGYMLEIDGSMTFIGNVLTYTATYSVALPHVYRVATVDILGRQGPWSHEVRL